MGSIRQVERPGGPGPHGIQPGRGSFLRLRRRGLRQLPGGQQQTVPHSTQAFQTGGRVAGAPFQLHGQFGQGQAVQLQISVQALVFLEAGPLRAQGRRVRQQPQHGFPVSSGERGRHGGRPGRCSPRARHGRHSGAPGKKDLRPGLFPAVGIIKGFQQGSVRTGPLPGHGTA